MHPGLTLTRTSTPDQIARGLADLIARGEMAPGEPIRESALATSLGVSRNTVREALHALRATGLVTHQMHKGIVVREPSVIEAEELYRVREVLEVAGIEHAELPGGLDSLSRALDDYEQAAGRSAGQEMVEKDLAFHAALVGLLGSPRLDAFFADLAKTVRFYLTVLAIADREHERAGELVREHAAIHEALSAGDRAGAERLLTAHLRANAERVITLVPAREGREGA